MLSQLQNYGRTAESDRRDNEMVRLPDPPVGPVFFPFGYDNFECLVGRLKRSAIDAYWCGGTAFDIVGDHYENRMSTGRWVTRPDEYGRGGGVPLHEGEDWGDADDVADDIEAEFDEVRHKVDGLVDKWRDLPDPAQIQGEVDQWQALFAALDSAAPDGGQDPVVRNVGRLQDWVNGDAEHGIAPHLVGDMAETFKDYVDNLYTAVSACRDVALVTGAAMAAQQGLWQAARQDFASILTETADRLDEIAGRGPTGDLSTVFTVAGIVLTIVGCFTAGATTVAVAGLGIGLGVVGPATTDSEKSRKVHSYSEALDFMDTLLNDGQIGLGWRIRREEDNIRCNIVGSVDAVNQNRSAFDPRPGPIESTDGIRRPEQSALETAYKLMSDIGSGLAWVGYRARGSAMMVGGITGAPWAGRKRCLVERDHEIGIGRTGPTEEFQTLADLLATLVLELSWEVGEGEKNLRAAVDVLDRTDADTRARLRAVASELASGFHGDGL